MASESTEDESVRVSLPAEVAAWLDDRAADLDVDRERLLLQLVSAYRATAELDGEVDADDLEVVLGAEASLDDRVAEVVDAQAREMVTEELKDAVAREVRSTLDAELDDAVEERVEGVVADRIADAVDAALADRLEATPGEVRTELGERLDALERDVDEKVQDVRERVIQVKREADAKAAADHSHEDLARLDGVVTRLAEVESAVGSLEHDLADEAEDRADAVAEVEERLDEMQDRLQTVAWVVSDLRETMESQGGIEAVDRIKRSAAELDVDRAQCESCGEGVALGLLTEPNCPHCDATVTDIEAASGFFGKPQLLVAAQLESGE